MTYYKELFSRLQDFLRYTPHELAGIGIATLVAGFIFSFRDWGGEQFDAFLGLQHLFLIFILAAVSILFRLTCQKIYALNEGYKAEFNPWWMGLGISLVISFLSFGYLPLLLAGNMSVAFMIRQRLGEFRYAINNWHLAMIAYWGLLGNLIMAVLFSIGAYFLPESYFFSKGMAVNLILAAGSILPLPQLDGLTIFWGSRKIYLLGILLVLLAAALLLTRTGAGLLFAIIFALIYAGVYIIIGSEK